MFGGAYYIWIIGAFFVLVAGALGVVMLALWVGHLIEKKETGATHGFLELPMELRGKEGGNGGDETRRHEETKDHEGGEAGKGG
jgi:hypothetical protein